VSFRGNVSFPTGPFVEAYRRVAVQRMERAALVASDRAATMAKTQIRTAMRAASLGRLSNAIGSSSDLAKGRDVDRKPNGGFSASGAVFVRGRSERTLGSIEAYTEGAEILPVNGRWLWIAQPAIPSRVGRKRMTPALYVSGGFEQRIGKLQFVPGINSNEGLLVVEGATVDRFGRPGRARANGKRGRPIGGRVEKKFLVAFVGIRRTARVQRVDARAIITDIQRKLPDIWAQIMERGK
jgi:hypothetical protein